MDMMERIGLETKLDLAELERSFAVLAHKPPTEIEVHTERIEGLRKKLNEEEQTTCKT